MWLSVWVILRHGLYVGNLGSLKKKEEVIQQHENKLRAVRDAKLRAEKERLTAGMFLFVYVVFGWYVRPWICPAVRLPMVKIDTSFLLPLGDYIEKLFQSFHSNHPLLCSTISHTHTQLVSFCFKITIYWLWTWAIKDWLELTHHIPFLIFFYIVSRRKTMFSSSSQK